LNSWSHFLAADGFKIAFIGFAVAVRVLRWQSRRAAQNRPKMPPQSASTPQPMKPQKILLTSAKKTQTKIEGSPWTNSNDPFNS
jgi:membrane protein implicated in regulation of membrane protease activity